MGGSSISARLSGADERHCRLDGLRAPDPDGQPADARSLAGTPRRAGDAWTAAREPWGARRRPSTTGGPTCFLPRRRGWSSRWKACPVFAHTFAARGGARCVGRSLRDFDLPDAAVPLSAQLPDRRDGPSRRCQSVVREAILRRLHAALTTARGGSGGAPDPWPERRAVHRDRGRDRGRHAVVVEADKR